MQNVSRFIVGIIAVPLIFSVIVYLPLIFFVSLMAVIVFLALFEYFPLVLPASKSLPIRYKACYALAGVGITLAVFFRGVPGGLGVLFAGLLVLMGIIMGGMETYEQALQRVGALFLGYVYIALSLSLLLPAVQIAGNGRGLVLWLILVIWGGDTGAFYIGTFFGKHKVYPKVSPGKSIEGVIGGVLAAMFVGIVAGNFIATGFTVREKIILPIFLLLLGQFGDFTESMLKRGADVKDSSRLLKGHGGVLDRVDSFLFTIPFFLFYLAVR